MCGIVGYIGTRDALEVVVEGLRRLEYRGYDSAGVALISDGELRVAKKAGRIENLDKELVRRARCRASSASVTPGGPRTAPRTTSTRTRTPTPPVGSP